MHVQVMDHPLIQHKITLMRKKRNGVEGFPQPLRRNYHAHGL